MCYRQCVLLPILILGLAVLTLSCKKPMDAVPEPPQPEPVKAPVGEEVEPSLEITESFPSEDVQKVPAPEPSTIRELNDSGVLATVYFAFDSYELDDRARLTLQRNARWLRDHSSHAIRVEGHCDERGTIEYNLALGEHRASVVRDYMTSLGVGASRIRIVSYGEEEPIDSGHSESAWAKNRRAKFLFES